MTHDEANFHDPHTFKLERWIGPACVDIKEASQSFSLGTRACLGRKLMAATFSQGASITSFFIPKDKSLIDEPSSVTYMEINLILARPIWMYDMKMVNKSMDWESESCLL